MSPNPTPQEKEIGSDLDLLLNPSVQMPKMYSFCQVRELLMAYEESLLADLKKNGACKKALANARQEKEIEEFGNLRCPQCNIFFSSCVELCEKLSDLLAQASHKGFREAMILMEDKHMANPVIPMGVDEWKAHGLKYQYYDYFAQQERENILKELIMEFTEAKLSDKGYDFYFSIMDKLGK